MRLQAGSCLGASGADKGWQRADSVDFCRKRLPCTPSFFARRVSRLRFSPTYSTQSPPCEFQDIPCELRIDDLSAIASYPALQLEQIYRLEPASHGKSADTPSRQTVRRCLSPISDRAFWICRIKGISLEFLERTEWRSDQYYASKIRICITGLLKLGDNANRRRWLHDSAVIERPLSTSAVEFSRRLVPVLANSRVLPRWRLSLLRRG